MIPGLSFILLSGLSTLAGATVSVTWSNQKYGPDGPWQAVEAYLGENLQTVDLYPGDTWASVILLDKICSTPNVTGSCLAELPGTFNIGTSDTTFIPSFNPNDTSELDWRTGSETTALNKFSAESHSKASTIGDTIKCGGLTVPNVSILAVYEGYQTYPNGKYYPLEVGTLSLGATKTDHIVEGNTFNLFGAYNWAAGLTESYSWGMHIGSVNPSISGSLILGGYDSDRIVGNISSQAVDPTDNLGALDITMYDIGLGVADGASPWSFGSQTGFFRKDGSSGDRPGSVTFDPVRPYLYLPKDTCDALAEHLPVTYDEGLNLYFWDTDDTLYSNITNSPAYLSFTFENNGGDDTENPKITIKVPFNLLKLTLEPPLVEQNTTYFPCYPSDDYYLGRAFLQATFLGTNWQNGTGGGYWFFAQAPGPVLSGSSLETIEVDDTTVSKKSTISWEDSWSGWWEPLSETPTNETSSSSSSSHGDEHEGGNGGGLSQGGKIGVGVGCGVGGALLICGACFLFLRFKKRTPVEHSDTGPYGPGELSASDEVTELDGPLLSEAGGSELVSEVHGEANQAPSSVSRSRGGELESGEVASELP